MSGQFQTWKQQHEAQGHFVAKVASMHLDHDPSRWGAFNRPYGIVESFLKYDGHPELERVIPAGAP